MNLKTLEIRQMCFEYKVYNFNYNIETFLGTFRESDISYSFYSYLCLIKNYFASSKLLPKDRYAFYKQRINIFFTELINYPPIKIKNSYKRVKLKMINDYHTLILMVDMEELARGITIENIIIQESILIKNDLFYQNRKRNYKNLLEEL